MKNLKILVTCGPTYVPIDDVRVISNRSSGEMGHLIAQEFIGQGAKVTLIEGAVTHAWSSQQVKIIKYQFFDELAKILNAELKKAYDAVIHAAAVSDFKVTKIVKGKIDSTKSFSLKLTPTVKLIDNIKKIAPKTFLVGFKLKSDHLFKEAQGLFHKAHCDLVVANSLKNGYRGFIVDQQGQILAKASSKKNLAKSLVKLLKKSL